jgi:ribose transport system substrate-binding protein
MVSAGANAIILYPLSPTALNRAIRAACQKGVVVMAYDSTVTEPCAYNVTSLSARYGSNIAQWIVNQLGGKGEVVINHGVAGTANTVINDELAMKVFKQYPGIKIVSEFYGNWNDATSQQEMAKALAAHPNVDAVWTVDGTYGTLQAVMQNRPNRLVVIAGQSNNGFRLQIADKALQAKGLKGLSTSSGPSIGGYAFKLMMEIVTKQKTLTGHTVEFPLPWVPAAEVKLGTGDKLENGCNTFPAGKVSPLFLNTALNAQLLPELSLTAVQSGKATAGVKIQALPAVKYAANLPGVTCTDCKAAADAWKPTLVTPIAVK